MSLVGLTAPSLLMVHSFHVVERFQATAFVEYELEYL